MSIVNGLVSVNTYQRSSKSSEASSSSRAASKELTNRKRDEDVLVTLSDVSKEARMIKKSIQSDSQVDWEKITALKEKIIADDYPPSGFEQKAAENILEAFL
ncbi:negative regulator of flagellin synthesis FlgM [Candidatus Magnetomoraceae bacterium gMMP-15]